jgi:protein-disulfide isomerase
MKRYFPFVIIIAVLLAAIAGASVLFRSRQTGSVGDSTPFSVATSSTPAASTQIPSQAPAQTPVQAPTQAKDLPNVSVTVEEYGDYQCPPCGVLYPELKKIEAEYGNRIDFIFHNFPLTKNHKNALAAAQAAEAARLQNRFWQMHDFIYDNQNVWKDQEDPRPTFTKYARALGLDLKRFARDLDGPEVQQRIAEDKQRADSLGIQGTPTVLVEGRQLKPEVTTPEGIRKGIDLMLARKAGKQ